MVEKFQNEVLNCLKIHEHMLDGGCDSRFIQAALPALNELSSSGMHPYMIALEFLDLSADVVLTSLPTEEFGFYGEYLGKVSARIGRNVLAKEDIIRRLTGTVDGWDLRELG